MTHLHGKTWAITRTRYGARVLWRSWFIQAHRDGTWGIAFNGRSLYISAGGKGLTEAEITVMRDWRNARERR